MKKVRGSDAVWLQDSPANLMVINAIGTMDRIDLDTLRRVWRTRVTDAEGARYERLTQRVVTVRGRRYWQFDPEFHVDRHIIPAPVDDLDTKEKLESWVGAVANQPLPGDRPGWQIQHVYDFAQDASAMIVRIHHSIGDGMGLLPVLFALMDVAAPATPPRHPAQPSRKDAALGAFARMVKAPLAGPYVLLKLMTARADRSTLHGQSLCGQKRVAWSEPISLESVKEVSRRLGATVNDVLMACVAGGVRRYLTGASAPLVDSIRISMPVNVRRQHEIPALENRFAAVLLELPVDIGSATERVAATKRRVDALKRSVEPLVVYGAVSLLLNVLPRTVSGGLIDFLANKCTCVLTNVPGPRQALSIAGRTVRTLMFWVPQRANIGLGISIFSFAGHVQIGALSDTDVLPDPAAFIRACEEEFAELVATVP